MPPKRAKKKSKAHKGTGKSENDDNEDVKGNGLDHRILLNPALKLKEIVELGSSSTMRSWGAIFTENLDFLQAQKTALKEIIRNAGAPEKSVPKTPRRGAAAFARLRETAYSYTSYSLTFEDREPKQGNEESDQQLETISQAFTAAVTVSNVDASDGDAVHLSSQAPVEEFFEVGPPHEDESGSSYEDAHNSMHNQIMGNCEIPELGSVVASVQQRDVEDSTCTMETYVTAKNSTERLAQPELSVQVKTECMSPAEQGLSREETVYPPSVSERICTTNGTNAALAVTADIKKEVHSSEEDHVQRSTAKPLAESPKRVLRSAARAKAGAIAKTPPRPHYGYETAASSSRNQNIRGVVPTPQSEGPRAAAGASHTRIAKVAHEHIVTTPCKRQYKSAVRRVMEDQDIARALSPKRATVPTPSRTKAPAQNPSRADLKAAAKARAEALRKEKEEKAALLREEQCRERAERLRKEREEKQLKAKRRRHEKEIEERQKAEALKKKEELEERRREEFRLHKSPARSYAVSRVNSPSRLPKMVANNQARSASKALFISTPGRVPSKIARVQEEGGATTREPTMNTPSRESRRKPYPSRMARMSSGNSAGKCLWSPKKELIVSPQKKQRCDQVRQFAMEHRERLRCEEEERIRIRQAREDRQNLVPKLEVDEADECSNLGQAVQHVPTEDMEEDDLRADEEDDRNLEEEDRSEQAEEELRTKEESRLQQEEDLRKLSEERRREARVREESLARELLEAELRRKEEEERRLEEDRKLGEKRLQEEAEAKTKELRRIEEEEAKARLNVSTSAELFNRHLANVSLNTSNVENRSPSRDDSHSSYEMTPDKKYKPASENDYNIEDLSSGDETDQEDAPRKKVPVWAEGQRFKQALERIAREVQSGAFDPNAYFGGTEAPDLTLIFGNTKRYPRRGSSGVWESPINKPRQGIGAYQNRMNKKY